MSAAEEAAPRRAYATLVTSDSFLMGAQAMLFSLRETGTRYPCVALVTAAVGAATRAKLTAAGADVREVPAVPNPNENVTVEGWVNSGYTKLHVWGLTDFDAVLYVDADALVLRNVDALFERDVPLAAAPDVFPPDKFNAGVLLLRPDQAVLDAMLAAAPDTPSHDGGDTGFLNSFFPDWYASEAAARLPFACNAQRTLHWFTAAKNRGYWDAVGDISILHFSSTPKPWDAEGARKKGELEVLWWEVYVRSQVGGLLLGPGLTF